MITRRGVLKLFGAGFVALLATAAYPFIEVLARPRITRYALTPRSWTPGLALRVAVIADIHACEPWMSSERIDGICTQAQELEADLILLLGDYVTGMNLVTGPVHSSAWAAALGKLHAPLGVHAILGNHDYWEDRAYQLDQSATPFALKALRDAGIATYINEVVRLEKDGHGFWLVGLADQMALLPGSRYGRTRMAGLDDLDATLAAVTDDAPVLLMAHEPDIFPSVGERVGLTLSGHTHGGQINLFGWRPSAASIGSRRYPAGYYNVDGRELIVSRGLGCSIVPMRVGSWPEVLLLELGAT
ncbi:MAG: ykuE [Devosia sp.]|uniref:metallophosphoesterase n=1 Tax=Devosia sp. TaxID=1871048 RepID=UPI002618C62D|nr:metallophosphoesterase [Devosia sp.]MDB5542378.1 ykuE [Devosia sp.]